MVKKELIIHAVVDVNGGIGSVVMNLIKYQLKQGYKVGIIYSKYYEPFFNDLDKDVFCYKAEMGKYPGSYMVKGLNLERFYKEISLKYRDRRVIIHAHNVASIGLFTNIKDIPIICTIHGISRNGIRSIRGDFSEYIYKMILRKLKKYNKPIIAVSNDTSKYYQKFISDYKINTIHNGAIINDVNIYKNKKFVIGHVGDISYSKGWDTTFEAYQLLSEQYKENIEFKFAGKILDISEEEISNLIKDNNMEDRVFYLGRVPNASDNVIPQLDLLILSSISEGLPMVIIEAQGRGIPVIATDVGGINEVINSGENGFLVKKDPIEIRNKIIELYDNKEYYKQMSINALKLFRSKFAVEQMGSSYNKYYDKI